MASTPMRAFRVPDERWDRASAQAQEDGVNLSAALNDLIEQYGNGRIRLTALIPNA